MKQYITGWGWVELVLEKNYKIFLDNVEIDLANMNVINLAAHIKKRDLYYEI